VFIIFVICLIANFNLQDITYAVRERVGYVKTQLSCILFIMLKTADFFTYGVTSHTQPSMVIPATCNITSQGLTDSPPDRLRTLVLDVYFATVIKYNYFRNIQVVATEVQTRQERLGHP